MVITLLFQEAESPEGKPVTAPIPVAPVVAMVMGVSGVLGHTVGLAEGVEAVLSGFTVTVEITGLPKQPFKLGTTV